MFICYSIVGKQTLVQNKENKLSNSNEKAYKYKMKMLLILNKDFVKVADTKDIEPSQMKAVEVGDENICVINVEGKYYAIGNVCMHQGGPLADGTLEGYEVECPLHGAKFDIRTGEVTNPPASTPEPAYEVKVEDNNILIKKRD